MHRFSVVCLLGILGGALAGGTAYAQGFGVYEQGACMMGRAGAGVAAPCADGSGVFFNPAGLSFDARHLTFGAVLIGPQGEFSDTSSGALRGNVSTLNKAWYPVPNIYMSMPIKQKYAVGLGVFAPYGLTTDWPETSQGRYLGYKSLVQGLYIQPTFSMKVTDTISVGGGVDLTYVKVELRQRVDLSQQMLPNGVPFSAVGVPANTDFADVQLQGHAWSAGYHLGLLVKAHEKMSLGLRFLSGQKVDVTNGTITTRQIQTGLRLPAALGGAAIDTLVAPQFAAGGALGNQNATTTLPMPAQFVAGAALTVTPKVKVMADYQFTRWSAFDVLPVNGDVLKKQIVEDYQDTHGVRIGTDITLGARSVLRAGVDLHGAAAPDKTVTPNLPEGSRREFTVGFGSQLAKKMRVDVAYMYLGQPDRAGRSHETTTNNGVYSFMAHLFGASMTIGF